MSLISGKNGSNTTFDVTMGSFDCAEVCELVGLFILNSLAEKYGKDYVGLYRDDELILLKGTSKLVADKARKDLHRELPIKDYSRNMPPNRQIPLPNFQFIQAELPALSET
jgi:hypothetical protein